LEGSTGIVCTYCNNPLECDDCREPYVPPSPEHYAALSRPEVALACPECGATLICHWCKTPYDGGEESEVNA